MLCPTNHYICGEPVGGFEVVTVDVSGPSAVAVTPIDVFMYSVK